jgi:arsenate reductase
MRDDPGVHADIERLQVSITSRKIVSRDAETRRLAILFLCTGNSCRSQMAEGWARKLLGNQADVSSAGIEKHGLNRRAVQVMAEAGVDISQHKSKTVGELPGRDFDYVITVCGHAYERCPLFPGQARIVHVGFDDPPSLAQSAATEEEALGHYRRVRDEIRAFVETLPGALEHMGALTKNGTL